MNAAEVKIIAEKAAKENEQAQLEDTLKWIESWAKYGSKSMQKSCSSLTDNNKRELEKLGYKITRYKPYWHPAHYIISWE